MSPQRLFLRLFASWVKTLVIPIKDFALLQQTQTAVIWKIISIIRLPQILNIIFLELKKVKFWQLFHDTQGIQKFL